MRVLARSAALLAMVAFAAAFHPHHNEGYPMPHDGLPPMDGGAPGQSRGMMPLPHGALEAPMDEQYPPDLVDFIVVGNDDRGHLLGTVGFSGPLNNHRRVEIKLLDKETGHILRKRSLYPSHHENPYALKNFGKLRFKHSYILIVTTPQGKILNRQVFKARRELRLDSLLLTNDKRGRLGGFLALSGNLYDQCFVNLEQIGTGAHSTVKRVRFIPAESRNPYLLKGVFPQLSFKARYVLTIESLKGGRLLERSFHLRDHNKHRHHFRKSHVAVHKSPVFNEGVGQRHQARQYMPHEPNFNPMEEAVRDVEQVMPEEPIAGDLPVPDVPNAAQMPEMNPDVPSRPGLTDPNMPGQAYSPVGPNAFESPRDLPPPPQPDLPADGMGNVPLGGGLNGLLDGGKVPNEMPEGRHHHHREHDHAMAPKILGIGRNFKPKVVIVAVGKK